MDRLRNALTLFAFAIVLAGCASLGTEPAQSFNQRLAYAEATHTAVLEATDSSLNAGTITSSQAQTIVSQSDNAELVLSAAKTAYQAGDTAGANAKLATALTALQALQDYLRAQHAH